MRALRLLGAGAVVLMAACGGDGGDPLPKPVSGEFTVSLATPFVGQDGGMIVRVIGPIDTVTAVNGYKVSFTRQGNILRAVVTGNIEAGDLLRVKVPDVSQVNAYTAFVEQAAARSTYALLDVSGYSLTLRAP